MPRDVLFVQGAGEGAHQVDGRLAASLARELGPEYALHYPRMPGEGSPDDAAWKQVVWTQMARLGDGAILVGHSVGASVLVRALAERELDRRPGGVFLISAPFCGEGGWQVAGCELPSDLAHRLPRGVPVFLYQGMDDDTVAPAHDDLYAGLLPAAVIRRLPGRDHQLNDDLSEVAADIEQLSSNPPRTAAALG